MLQGHGLNAFVGIEMLTGERCYLRMHAPLMVQDAHELAAPLMMLPADETLEEGLATVGQTDVAQTRFFHTAGFLVGLYHGGQLLIVAHQHKATHAGMGQQTDDAGFENLRCLIDDAERERHQFQNLLT